ncbi:MAG: hypothetical protein JOZ27_08920, partial [Caulobacteraceae bacterium]|nr:hypothetical protein [Caulobacteraceae bacterium]
MKIARPILALAGLAAVAAAPARAAGAPFAAFQALCGDTNADVAKVRAAADAARFGPTVVTGETGVPGVTVTDTIARSGKAGAVPLTLSASTGIKGALKVGACTVRVGKS